jgi:hypothetical protein
MQCNPEDWQMSYHHPPPDAIKNVGCYFIEGIKSTRTNGAG